MKYRAHTVGAVAAGCGVVYFSNHVGLNTNSLAIISGAIIGGLIPDIDHPKSFLGSAIQPISSIIMATIGHRTLTHSLLFLSIVSCITATFDIMLGVGMGVGILSHIVLDILTPKTYGVAFLYPFYKEKIKLW